MALFEVNGALARLVDSRRVQGDEALLGWIGQSAPRSEPALLLIDAPVVCPNATGSRPVDRESHRVFGRQHAGCHPSNQRLCGRPLRLVTRLKALGIGIGWETGDPGRQMVEVYPHAASVVLFGLPKTLKYKQKSGREVGTLQSELLTLMGLVESLNHATPALHVGDCAGWAELSRAAQAATRKSQLRRVEDPVDAVVCAYIARYAAMRPDDVTIYGEPATGCIVTPALR